MKKTIVKVISFVSLALLIVGTLTLVGWGISTAISKDEIVECNKLERQSREYPDFYLTSWQSDMCEAHGFHIDVQKGE